MNLDYKKLFVRSSILLLVMIFGSYAICLYFGFDSFSDAAENKGVFCFGAFLGGMSGYMRDVFVEKKES